MSSVVSLRKGADKEEFLRQLRDLGVEFSEFSALQRTIQVAPNPEDFPLADHPDVEEILWGEEVVRPQRSVSLGPGFRGMESAAGNWGLLRHTHRDPPWDNDGFRFPLNGDFTCARTGAGVDFYIADGLVPLDHPEVAGRVTQLGNAYTTANAHGLAVASCGAGSISGLATDSEIRSYGVFPSDGGGSASAVTTGINACLSDYQSRAALGRPAVLNLSILGTLIHSVTAQCSEVGMVVVACAGNDRMHIDVDLSSDIWSHPYVITAGGIQMGDAPYNLSYDGTNYGGQVDILAAAQWIWLPSETGYGRWSGTSFAAPHVSGAIACILQDYERLTTRNEVDAILQYLRDQATYGRYKPYPPQEPMTRAILYLDPGTDYPPVPGLTPRMGQ